MLVLITGFGIEHFYDETGAVCSVVADGLEERLSLGNGWCMALVNRTGGPKSLHVAKELSQHVLVEIQDRVKRLILGTGGNAAFTGQVSEEFFQFFLDGPPTGHLTQCADLAAEPWDISLLRGEGLVLSANNQAHSVDCFGCIHTG